MGYGISVECAFGSNPNDATPLFTDLNPYCLLANGKSIQITRGRTDEFSQVQPSRLALVLDNADGRFTPDNAAGPYYPNVKKNRRIRVRVRYPDVATQSGNLVRSTDSSNFEGGTVGQWFSGGGAPTIANDATHADVGTKALKMTATTNATSIIAVPVPGHIIGRTYTWRARVYVPSVGGMDLSAAVGAVGFGTSTVGQPKDQFVTISMTYVATTDTMQLQLWTSSGTPGIGSVAWVDAVMADEGTSLGSYTVNAIPYFNRFDGFVDEWPVDWQNDAGTYSYAAVTATDRLGRLSRARKLRSLIEHEILLDSPFAYWTLGDGAGSAMAGESSGRNETQLAVTQQGTGGTATFGSATGPGFDSLTALQLTPASAANGKYLTGSLVTQNMGGLYGPIGMGCFFLTSSASVQHVLSVEDNNGTRIEASITAAGKLQVASIDVVGGTLYTTTSAATVADGQTHQVVVRHSFNAVSGIDATVYLDGLGIFTTTFSASWNQFIQRVFVGGRGDGRCFSGTIAHVVVYGGVFFGFAGGTPAGARAAIIWSAATTGFAGERSDQRIARLLSYAAQGTIVTSLETGLSTSIQYQDTTNNDVLSLINDVVNTENGLFFISGGGTCVFQARSHRYNQTTRATFNANEYGRALQPRQDGFGLLNDLTVSRTNGITTHIINSDSVTQYDTYSDQQNLITTSDNEVVDRANWLVNIYGTPRTRYSVVPIDVLTQQSAVAPEVLSIELSDQIVLAGLPPSAPASSTTLNVEGWTETLALDVWEVDYNASPSTQSAVWVLDSSQYSQLDQTTTLAY